MFESIRRRVRGYVRAHVVDETMFRDAVVEQKFLGIRADLADCAAQVLRVNDRVSRHAGGSRLLLDLLEQLNKRVKAVEAAQVLTIEVYSDAAETARLRTELNAKSVAISDLQDELAETRAEACEGVPTWVDSKGRVHRIDQMPTPYIVNCISLLRGKGVTSVGAGSGILNALRNELAARDRCAAAGRVG